VLAARPLAEADLPALADLLGRCLGADGGLPDAATEPFLRRQFLSGPGQAWVGERPGSAAGTGSALIAVAALGRERDGRVTAAGAVDPEFRSRGIGRALLDWTLSRAQGRPLLVETETVSMAAAHLYGRYGLREVFAELVLRADLRGLALPGSGTMPVERPSEVLLRPWQDDLVGEFFAAYQAAFADRPGFPGWSQGQWLDWTAGDEDFRPGLSLLATGQAGEPAGFVTVSGNWIVQAGVVPGWRRRGVGTLLVRAAMAGVSADGADACWLTVATNNPGAISLYRGLGFARAGCRARYAS
jgi:mycothiol synthase